jgi:hypothetical protein
MKKDVRFSPADSILADFVRGDSFPMFAWSRANFGKLTPSLRCALNLELSAAGLDALAGNEESREIARRILALGKAKLGYHRSKTPQTFLDMTAIDLDAVVDAAIAIEPLQQSETNFRVYGTLKRIAALRRELLAPRLPDLARAGMLDPPEMYYNAPKELSPILLEKYGNRDTTFVTAYVAMTFGATDDDLRAACDESAMSLQTMTRLAHFAGYELMADLTRRPLHIPECRAIRRESMARAEGGLVRSFFPAEVTCPRCQAPAVSVIDLNDQLAPMLPSLFAPSLPRNLQLRVLACLRCMHDYQFPQFARFDLAGGSQFIEDNAKGDMSRFHSEYPSRIWIDAATHSPLAAVADALEGADGQLGGLPKWEQEPEYPDCPDCRKSLVFLFSWAGSYDGTLYAFICPGCRVSCVTTQFD